MALCIPLTGRLSDRVGRRPVLWIGAVSTIVLAYPAFLLIGLGSVWSTLLGLAMIAFPVTFYVSTIASALPALFPAASRYGAMGISYNFAVAVFGGTTPFIIAALIVGTGNDMMPAFYLIGTSLIGAVAIYFLRESASAGPVQVRLMPLIDAAWGVHDRSYTRAVRCPARFRSS